MLKNSMIFLAIEHPTHMFPIPMPVQSDRHNPFIKKYFLAKMRCSLLATVLSLLLLPVATLAGDISGIIESCSG